MTFAELSAEQQQFIQTALSGQNILVDACIGSGKTTAIQTLCQMMGGRKRVLYMTYNKLLKEDAKTKIRTPLTLVTNYHGFAYMELRKIGRSCGMNDLLQAYHQFQPPVTPYDVLILDEYQDIEQESADLLWHIKDSCPNLQIIVVGDMAQKIYDKTRLDVQSFLSEFLDTYVPLEFTQCFRIGCEHAEMLSRVWGKKIVGVNPNCEVRQMAFSEAVEYASSLSPGELLVLGSNSGDRNRFQNELEDLEPAVFNAYTVWSKISEHDGQATSPGVGHAIFTTYDGCKGMERDVCFVFDWTLSYWNTRLSKPSVRYEILRNIFCVAASRGKRQIIFVESERDEMLTEADLCASSQVAVKYSNMDVSEVFQHKFAEDVETAYQCLSVDSVAESSCLLPVNLSYGLVDLSPCIAVYAKACYFQNYRIDDAIYHASNLPGRGHLLRPERSWMKWGLHSKIQYEVMLETLQQRYYTQVPYPLVSLDAQQMICDRLSVYLPKDVSVQSSVQLPVFSSPGHPLFALTGCVDAIYRNEVWYLKFVQELTHVHCLELAMQLVMTGFSKGKLFNVATGEVLLISIPDVAVFLDKVAYAITKGQLKGYICEDTFWCQYFQLRHPGVCGDFVKRYRGTAFRGVKFVTEFFAHYGLQLPMRPAVLRDVLLGKPKKQQKRKDVTLGTSRKKISVKKPVLE